MLPPASAHGAPGSGRNWAVASVLAAMTLVVLDAAITTIALPSISASLHTSAAGAVQIVTAYQLGVLIGLLPAAALGESLGLRKMFVAGALLFTIASGLCGLSPSLEWLLAARFAQGLGGAGVLALGVALLRFTVPSDKLGAAIGWNALTVALSSAAGPTVGAAILSITPWPWLFLVNLPIGLFVLFAARSLPPVQGNRRPVDLVSVALNASTFGLIVAGAEFAPSGPSGSLMLFVGAGACAVLLIRREFGRVAPLVPFDLLGQRSFRLSVTASVLCFVGQAAALVALPFHLQMALGLSPLQTILYLTPWPLTVALTGPFAGKLADRASTARLCLAGGSLLALGLGAAALLPLHGPPFALAVCMMLSGLGFGLFNVPNNRNMFLSAPRQRSGAAGGMQGMARLAGQIGGALTMSLMFSLVPLDLAPRVGLALASALTLAAGLVSIRRAGGTNTLV